jgi:hypothetical protein
MTVHELKVKYIANLHILDFYIHQTLLNKRVSLIFKQKEFGGLNLDVEMKETYKLGHELYGSLENLFLEGENVYPILSKYIKELNSEINNKNEHCLAILNDYREIVNEANIRLVLKSQSKEDNLNDSPNEDNDFFLLLRYASLENYSKSLSEFYENLKFISSQIENNTKPKNNSNTDHKKKFPPLPECFLNPTDFNKVFSIPQIADIYVIHKDGTYHLKRGRKIYLACLAQRLKDRGKLIEEIKSNQDLARTFCPYFNIKFNSKHEKQFEPERIGEVPRTFYDLVVDLIK